MNTSHNDPLQLIDDDGLIDCMMEDLSAAAKLYQPTNYWSLYEKPIIDELRSHGLRDFRRRENTTLQHFAGSELIRLSAPVVLTKVRFLYNRLTRKIPGWPWFLKKTSKWLTENAMGDPIYDIDRPSAHLLISQYILSMTDRFNGVPITDLSCSLVGNPEDIIEIEGKPYTYTFLSHYLRYLYLSRFVSFADHDYIVELGSGMGQFAEILHQISPETPIILFDIAPALYVGDRYLSKIFPNDCVDYLETRNWTDLTKITAGKIYFFCTGRFPMITKLKNNLFINCASFQEMEPNVVKNYLSFANQSSKSIYLQQYFNGKAEASSAGLPGVLKRTVISDYLESLTNFNCIDRSLGILPCATASGAENAYFSRK